MNGIDRRSFLKGVLAAGTAISGTGVSAATPGFELQDGDTVVFYGDSITSQKLYTVYTEAFVLTRFHKCGFALYTPGGVATGFRAGVSEPSTSVLKEMSSPIGRQS